MNCSLARTGKPGSYGKGWIAVIEVADTEELKNLLSAEAYQKLIGGN